MSSPSTTISPAATPAGWAGSTISSGSASASSCTGSTTSERRQAYACDITYGTNNEFGFDYLRDNMKYEMAHMVQRGHAYAIVDEVDSILVDEARTPLIISGPSEDRSGLYASVDTLIPQAGARGLRHRREAAHGQPHRSRQRARRGDAARNRRAEGGLALRGRQRDARASRQSGVARPQAVHRATRITSSATATSSSSTSSPAA